LDGREIRIRFSAGKRDFPFFTAATKVENKKENYRKK
jgi:hypothetical protein